jgi:hypothetical protein
MLATTAFSGRTRLSGLRLVDVEIRFLRELHNGAFAVGENTQNETAASGGMLDLGCRTILGSRRRWT